MFNTLLASNVQRSRVAPGATLSVAVHGGLIATAVWLTAMNAAAPSLHAHDSVRPVWVTPPPPAPRLPSTTVPRVAQLLPAPARLAAPLAIPDVLPPVDLTAAPMREPVWGAGPPGSPYGTSTSAGAAHDPLAPFDAAYVDKPVELLPGQATPRYPDMMRTSGVEGHVVMRFIVDTLGRVEPASVQVVEANHALFSEAVRAALMRQRFIPAEAGGHRVRQLVVQPFEFRIVR